MTKDLRHSVSVAAVIVDAEGGVLLIQRRDNGRWEPPGGVLELDEQITAGLHREVREETGLDVEPERLTGVYKNMAQGIVSLVFRCRAVGGTLSETDEARSLRWASPQELSDLMPEAYSIRLLDGLRTNGDCPAVRDHDGTDLL